MATRVRPKALSLGLAALAAPALACIPPPLALADGEVVVADGNAPLRLVFGAGDGPVQAVPLRHLSGSVEERALVEAYNDDRVAGAEPITMASIAAGDQRWTFVLTGPTLAAAEFVPEYRLLDALTVQTDPGGFPSLRQVFRLDDATPALLVTNAHFNSQEGFAQHTLLALVDGELRPLWEGPLLYSLSTGDDACDLRRVEQTLETFAAGAPAAGAFPDIDVRFVETERCEKDGVATPSQPREFATTLRWDAAASAYVGTLPELEALNAQRRGD